MITRSGAWTTWAAAARGTSPPCLSFPYRTFRLRFTTRQLNFLFWWFLLSFRGLLFTFRWLVIFTRWILPFQRLRLRRFRFSIRGLRLSIRRWRFGLSYNGAQVTLLHSIFSTGRTWFIGWFASSTSWGRKPPIVLAARRVPPTTWRSTAPRTSAPTKTAWSASSKCLASRRTRTPFAFLVRCWQFSTSFSRSEWWTPAMLLPGWSFFSVFILHLSVEWKLSRVWFLVLRHLISSRVWNKEQNERLTKATDFHKNLDYCLYRQLTVTKTQMSVEIKLNCELW